METVLMVVTVVALAFAIGMSVLAWRLLRDNRQRSSARVEALQAMAAETEPHARFAPVEEVDELEGEEDVRKSDVDAWDLGLREDRAYFAPSARPHAPSPAPRDARAKTRGARTSAALPDTMFGATAEVRTGAPPRRWLALAVVGLVMAAAVSTVYALYRPAIAEASTAGSIGPSAPAPPHTAGPRPLELLSLRHGVDPTGSFTVTGLVQNPLIGQPVRKVIAVVYLFDRDGNYFASGKASLDFTMLQPGDESPFVVHVPNVSRVSRYRVGFRSEEGGIVAHIDRRGQLPGGTTGDAIDVQRSAAAKRPEGRP